MDTCLSCGAELVIKPLLTPTGFTRSRHYCPACRIWWLGRGERACVACGGSYTSSAYVTGSAAELQGWHDHRCDPAVLRRKEAGEKLSARYAARDLEQPAAYLDTRLRDGFRRMGVERDD